MVILGHQLHPRTLMQWFLGVLEYVDMDECMGSSPGTALVTVYLSVTANILEIIQEYLWIHQVDNPCHHLDMDPHVQTSCVAKSYRKPDHYMYIHMPFL